MDGGDARNYYLQYPVNYRDDRLIRKLEAKLGPLAPWVYLEMNGLAATFEGAVIRYDVSDESYVEQLAFDIRYPQQEELVGQVLDFMVKRQQVEMVEEGKAYYFPWARSKTQSRTKNAERQARHRAKLAYEEDGGSNAEDNAYRYESNAERYGERYGGDGQSNGERYKNNDNKNKSKNKSKSKSKELELEKEIERDSYDADDGESVNNIYSNPMPSSSQSAPSPEELPALPIRGGDEWRPSVDDIETWSRSFPGVDLYRAFSSMRSWASNQPGGGLAGKPGQLVWRWLTNDQHSLARAMAAGQMDAKRRADGQQQEPGHSAQFASFQKALNDVLAEENAEGE